jgi:hypothetical protein
MNPQDYRSSGRTTPTPRQFHSQLSTAVSNEEIVSFTFASTRTGTTGILNSAVVGRDACPYFHVMTDAGWLPGHTVFRTNKGHTIASVEWRGKGGTTFVEIQPSVMKQPVSAWLLYLQTLGWGFLESFTVLY